MPDMIRRIHGSDMECFEDTMLSHSLSTSLKGLRSVRLQWRGMQIAKMILPTLLALYTTKREFASKKL